jgi:hypothetical protein
MRGIQLHNYVSFQSATQRTTLHRHHISDDVSPIWHLAKIFSALISLEESFEAVKTLGASRTGHAGTEGCIIETRMLFVGIRDE